MKLELSLRFTSDWHIGSGAGVPGGVDRALRRGSDDLPYVPAKSVIGMLRESSDEIASGLGGDWPKIFTQLFGGPKGARKSRVSIRRLRLDLGRMGSGEADRPLRRYLSFPRFGVALEDGLAAKDKLFLTELGRSGLRFVGTGELDIDAGDGHGLALVAVAAQRVVRIGGGRRRGLGRCTLEITAIGDDGEPIKPDLELLRSDQPQLSAPRWVRKPVPLEVGAEQDELVVIPLVIETVVPVLATAGTVGNVVESHPFIPGTMLLGPVVDALGGWPSLGRYVFSGALRVLNANPTAAASRTKPVPLAFSRMKGATTDDPIVNEAVVEHRKGLRPLRGGFVSLDARGQAGLIPTPIVTNSHATIDAEQQRPTSRVGGVYTYRAIEDGILLASEIVLPSTALGEVPEGSFSLAIGTAKKDDYGLCRAHFGVPRPLAVESGRSYQTGDSFALWLASDTIVLDEFLQPCPTDEGIRAALERLGEGLELRVTKSFIRATRREGWSGLAGLPRPTNHCVAAGSVVTFSVVEGSLSAAAVAALEGIGLGERTAEGFGEVMLDPAELAEPQRDVDGKSTCDPASAVTPEGEGFTVDKVFLQSAVLEAAHQAVVAAAPTVAEELGLNRRDRDGDRLLSNTQLGALRRVVGDWASDETAIQVWLSGIKATATRQKTWSKLLPDVERIAGDPAVVLRWAQMKGVDDLMPLVSEQEARRLTRVVASSTVVEAVRYAVKQRRRSEGRGN